jgi:predicted  nucleic acid-binding Zn-ribbon protein
MKTKVPNNLSAGHQKLTTEIAAAQREADAAKKKAQDAKAAAKAARKNFKEAKRTAKKLKKAVKALKEELRSHQQPRAITRKLSRAQPAGKDNHHASPADSPPAPIATPQAPPSLEIDR